MKRRSSSPNKGGGVLEAGLIFPAEEDATEEDTTSTDEGKEDSLSSSSADSSNANRNGTIGTRHNHNHLGHPRQAGAARTTSATSTVVNSKSSSGTGSRSNVIRRPAHDLQQNFERKHNDAVKKSDNSTSGKLFPWYTVPLRGGWYQFCSITIIFFNKWILHRFPYPVELTMLGSAIQFFVCCSTFFLSSGYLFSWGSGRDEPLAASEEPSGPEDSVEDEEVESKLQLLGDGKEGKGDEDPLVEQARSASYFPWVTTQILGGPQAMEHRHYGEIGKRLVGLGVFFCITVILSNSAYAFLPVGFIQIMKPTCCIIGYPMSVFLFPSSGEDRWNPHVARILCAIICSFLLVVVSADFDMMVQNSGQVGKAWILGFAPSFGNTGALITAAVLTAGFVVQMASQMSQVLAIFMQKSLVQGAKARETSDDLDAAKKQTMDKNSILLLSQPSALVLLTAISYGMHSSALLLPDSGMLHPQTDFRGFLDYSTKAHEENTLTMLTRTQNRLDLYHSPYSLLFFLLLGNALLGLILQHSVLALLECSSPLTYFVLGVMKDVFVVQLSAFFLAETLNTMQIVGFVCVIVSFSAYTFIRETQNTYFHADKESFSGCVKDALLGSAPRVADFLGLVEEVKFLPHDDVKGGKSHAVDTSKHHLVDNKTSQNEKASVPPVSSGSSRTVTNATTSSSCTKIRMEIMDSNTNASAIRQRLWTVLVPLFLMSGLALFMVVDIYARRLYAPEIEGAAQRSEKLPQQRKAAVLTREDLEAEEALEAFGPSALATAGVALPSDESTTSLVDLGSGGLRGSIVGGAAKPSKLGLISTGTEGRTDVEPAKHAAKTSVKVNHRHGYHSKRDFSVFTGSTSSFAQRSENKISAQQQVERRGGNNTSSTSSFQAVVGAEQQQDGKRVFCFVWSLLNNAAERRRYEYTRTELANVCDGHIFFSPAHVPGLSIEEKDADALKLSQLEYDDAVSMRKREIYARLVELGGRAAENKDAGRNKDKRKNKSKNYKDHKEGKRHQGTNSKDGKAKESKNKDVHGKEVKNKEDSKNKEALMNKKASSKMKQTTMSRPSTSKKLQEKSTRSKSSSGATTPQKKTLLRHDNNAKERRRTSGQAPHREFLEQKSQHESKVVSLAEVEAADDADLEEDSLALEMEEVLQDVDARQYQLFEDHADHGHGIDVGLDGVGTTGMNNHAAGAGGPTISLVRSGQEMEDGLQASSRKKRSAEQVITSLLNSVTKAEKLMLSDKVLEDLRSDTNMTQVDVTVLATTRAAVARTPQEVDALLTWGQKSTGSVEKDIIQLDLKHLNNDPKKITGHQNMKGIWPSFAWMLKEKKNFAQFSHFFLVETDHFIVSRTQLNKAIDAIEAAAQNGGGNPTVMNFGNSVIFNAGSVSCMGDKWESLGKLHPEATAEQVAQDERSKEVGGCPAIYPENIIKASSQCPQDTFLQHHFDNWLSSNCKDSRLIGGTGCGGAGTCFQLPAPKECKADGKDDADGFTLTRLNAKEKEGSIEQDEPKLMNEPDGAARYFESIARYFREGGGRYHYKKSLVAMSTSVEKKRASEDVQDDSEQQAQDVVQQLGQEQADAGRGGNDSDVEQDDHDQDLHLEDTSSDSTTNKLIKLSEASRRVMDAPTDTMTIMHNLKCAESHHGVALQILPFIEAQTAEANKKPALAEIARASHEHGREVAHAHLRGRRGLSQGSHTHFSSCRCESKSSAESSHPGPPCVHPYKKYPYNTFTLWRVALGDRIHRAIYHHTLTESQCNFKSEDGHTVCSKAFDKIEKQDFLEAVTIGHKDDSKDPWSKWVGKFSVPHKNLALLEHGKRDKGMQVKSLFEGAKALSRVVKMNVDTAQDWETLEENIAKDEDLLGKTRSLDLQLNFAAPGKDLKGSVRDCLEKRVALFERMLSVFPVATSNLEALRSEQKGDLEDEPALHLTGGLKVAAIAVSLVNPKAI
ncbi:unnamed protein product [Amoebophrya sp. A25]|nr:unnamed protein product [Amoebophrya sp. A25]|eukprot:GSA25T00012767001.1